MNFSDKTKRVLAAVAAGLLVLTIAFAGTMFWLIKRAPAAKPMISAYAHGKTIEVGPMVYCSVWLDDCRNGMQGFLAVPRGETMQVSLPKEVAVAPWKLIVQYMRPDGTVYEQDFEHASSNAEPAITVAGDDQLLLIELQLPSAVVDPAGARAAHAFWSIRTF